MVKLKKQNVKVHICPTCKGNGFLKVGTEFGDTVHQCWDCDSEGEFYVYESKDIIDDNDADNTSNNDIKLH
jgi:DnaJ-class molecular chaperone|tara:strand:+ start:2140 stop:2352 length:213 start_codon:yes stop_codon:yes gene_type:complete